MPEVSGAQVVRLLRQDLEFEQHCDRTALLLTDVLASNWNVHSVPITESLYLCLYLNMRPKRFKYERVYCLV